MNITDNLAVTTPLERSSATVDHSGIAPPEANAHMVDTAQDHPRESQISGLFAVVGDFYSSRLVIVSSVGQGGPALSNRRSSSPNRLPFGNWSPTSQRHPATIARTSCRQSSSSPRSTPG